ncbi:GNAT family N-acetyltransferase [Paenibacillus ginsengarvi]|uniref:GNAT family N-acetyltransferase n=1 Tax=Paenibacillus ginsengarvi TaxID=400777 RepID=A0A3B0BH66_9BACL|nr:GNAT family N-acetyltransferase [Paenibacillus ginsengarvi]RKN71216.1 GNAT family N-acetyltransferase [Paenibacillus ginsengarvi]
MNITLKYEKPDVLPSYGDITIAFVATSEYHIEPLEQGLGGLLLREVPIERPYTVDYDAEKGRGPERWLNRWDLRNWCVVSAYNEQEERIGGAVLAYDTPGVHFLEDRTDIAGLWDLRVKPIFRGQGVGKAIMEKAVEWARSKECKQLKIETQSNNVAACRFYAQQGAHLGTIERYAYEDKPHLARLNWYIDL